MSLPDKLTLSPIQKISGSVVLPGSKSLSNRILLLSMLAEGKTEIQNLLDSDDVRRMVEGLETLGIQLEENRAENLITVSGTSGIIPVKEATLMLGNAGTAIRPLTAAMTLGHGRFVLDGVQRMRERPIIDLINGLSQLGANLRCINGTDCPPVEVIAEGLPGGITRLSGAISSQYLTAILLAAPYADKEVQIEITDKLVSVPYVEMTLRLMQSFGVSVNHENFRLFHIPRQTYRSPGNIFVEGDASSASYFLAGAAITKGSVTVKGCGTDSLQGDARFAEVLEKMGAKVEWEPQQVKLTGNSLNGIDVDMNQMPDAAMTLAVAALFASGPTAIRNIYNWRVKETERLQAVSTELRKLGAEVEEGYDYLVIQPPEQIRKAEIDTYDDHRMAMAFSLAACGSSPVTINNPGCVSKTFPDYFEVLNGLCA
ncbi:MAG: 3-phosphoshikimate 1-carboxyvinyltransferase [Deltaproteobacteria bacterium]|jgi:3-phosphoshikimate 1-carboxyvinyltransferase|nr:3-phosphoshikimate 1-carboxyvinyltransferase [Deltaproteobacteria bacterium]MDG1860852.1 3-phosphoshikimate 1-carboxyvinyltransferase [SAR324 cluster bacterium]MBT5088012.1 3-phosphoshikimate 1-carboxyvinyltransferase [Deltaproteobacteria bacterium]MBT5485903.1 3-phosphoshikimate 1-carboxyvinyltransferase [Deltaproteobacteria bacterium]MBT5834736.1 3-phosphoshikimate 1-carboxyvinyltransferase [Deltaproteobacteria bacterium]